MNRPLPGVRLVVAVGMLLGAAALGRGGPCECLTLDRLQRMSLDELADLFARADVGAPPVGKGDGRLLALADRRPKLKAALANAAWRGKYLADDGSFINRWAGGVTAIESCYVIGPSHLDGRPAIIMEYAPGTPVLGRVRDELREVAPGLYLGPVFERSPCLTFRGFVGLRIDPCPRHGHRP